MSPTLPSPSADAGAPAGHPPRAGAVGRACARVLPVAVLLLAAALAPAQAQRAADRTLPLDVQAEAGRYDHAKQSGTFSGNVVVTQGTLVLRAAQVEVRQAADGSASAVATGATGTPARFRQKREGLDEVLEGEAQRIEYDGRADTLRFVDGAVLRRFRGGTLADEVAGSVIVFDNTAAVYSVVGGAPGTGGRVRATITPRPAAAAPTPVQPGGR